MLLYVRETKENRFWKIYYFVFAKQTFKIAFLTHVLEKLLSHTDDECCCSQE